MGLNGDIQRRGCLVQDQVEGYAVGAGGGYALRFLLGHQAGVHVDPQGGGRLDLPHRRQERSERHPALAVASPAEEETGAALRLQAFGEGPQIVWPQHRDHALQVLPPAMLA